MWARRLSPKLFRMTRAAGLCADVSTIPGVCILGVCGGRAAQDHASDGEKLCDLVPWRMFTASEPAA